MNREKWVEMIERIAHDAQFQAIEHLARHAAWLLRRARATLEAAQSLSYERSLPWAVEGALRDIDPEEIGAIKEAFEEVVSAIREARSRAEEDHDGALDDKAEGGPAAEGIDPLTEKRGAEPCAS